MSSASRPRSESPNAAQCSRSAPRRSRSPALAASEPQAPAQTASFQASTKCRPRPRKTGSDVPSSRWSKSPVRPALDARPLLLVHHRAPGRVQLAPGARVHDDEPRAAEVAPVAPARPGDLAVGAEGELPHDQPGVAVGVADLAPDLVLLAVLGREVAEVLEGPVRHEAPHDALVPPAVAAHLAHPAVRRVPVVVDVVVVEDHRGRRPSTAPSARAARPRSPRRGGSTPRSRRPPRRARTLTSRRSATNRAVAGGTSSA